MQIITTAGTRAKTTLKSFASCADISDTIQDLVMERAIKQSLTELPMMPLGIEMSEPNMEQKIGF
ncbi:hypothetical protein DMP06_07505 [Slackia equolifaciens]|uniref:Uncharacterized protein n=1 Tax=Slackia equolifaciens TaxID=498718 RepID=A0A3N0AX54_9ACTN|nr:hypothetical protein [Slackia equolifaciens]RNL39457.1 hypothetical protein DMP06_07505 [Slackia equolifaciens]